MPTRQTIKTQTTKKQIEPACEYVSSKKADEQDIAQVCFDKTVEALDPASVHKVKLSSGQIMPVAAFGTFHSDWAQDYMKEATVEARTAVSTGVDQL